MHFVSISELCSLFFLGITASLSSGVNDRAMNLDDNYEKTPNIEVSNQG